MHAVVAKAGATAETGFDLRNLSIEEVIVHRVFARDANKVVRKPIVASDLMSLPMEGLDAIQQRLTSALGSRSHGIEMTIERTDAESFLQLGAHAIGGDRAAFITASQSMAEKLSTAQATTSGSPGTLIVIRGKSGRQLRRFLAVIKAEVHDGFGTTESEQTVSVQYLNSLMLTPSQRLFKVGLLLEPQSGPSLPVGKYDAAGYRAFLFDHLITATETRSAAAYFYSSFLGMGIQKSSKKLTQDFFEHSQNFIQTASITEEQKMDLREALRVNLKSSETIISAADFAEAHIHDEKLRKSYRDYLDSKGFPKTSVSKDVEYVKSRLRRPRRLAFSTGVKVLVPADASSDVVNVIERTETQATLVVRGSFTETE